MLVEIYSINQQGGGRGQDSPCRVSLTAAHSLRTIASSLLLVSFHNCRVDEEWKVSWSSFDVVVSREDGGV